MTTLEFSSEFDILYNNIMSNQAPGLDEYEKSVFLTMAQEDLIITLYSGKNQYGNFFEQTEEIRRYVSDLIKTFNTSDKKTEYKGLSKSSVFFELPEDLWFITYESITTSSDDTCMNDKDILVVPITQDDYYKISRNPFRGAGKRRALRLDNSGRIAEIISDFDIKSYTVRYISKPEPIIITDLPEGISINGISTQTECKLNPVIHRAILERAVQLANQSKATNISAGN